MGEVEEVEEKQESKERFTKIRFFNTLKFVTLNKNMAEAAAAPSERGRGGFGEF